MKVDIILAVYKGKPRWITETIQSVISQTYKNWHLTVIDDACPENSTLIVKDLADGFPTQISLIKLGMNHGAAAARMKGIRHTNGQVIAFIDQDDRWLPNKLEKQIDRFNTEPAVQAVHTNINHIDESGALIKDSANKENELRASILFDRLSLIDLSKLIFLKLPIRLSTSVFLRYAFEEIGGYDGKIPFGGEDLDLWVRFSRRFKIGHIHDILVERRIHRMNTSRHFSLPRALGELKTSNQLLHDHPYLLPLAKQRLRKYYQSLVRIGISTQRPDISRYYARALVRDYPLHIGDYLRMGMAYSTVINKLVIMLYKKMRKIRLLR